MKANKKSKFEVGDIVFKIDPDGKFKSNFDLMTLYRIEEVSYDDGLIDEPWYYVYQFENGDTDCVSEYDLESIDELHKHCIEEIKRMQVKISEINARKMEE